MVIGIVVTSCKKYEIQIVELAPSPKHLPAYVYGDAEFFNFLCDEMYDIICQSSSDSLWQAIIVESIYNNDSNYVQDLLGTQTFYLLDSITREYMRGAGMDDLDPETSESLILWVDSLINSPAIDAELRYAIFSDQTITEYDVVALCMQCAFLRYINEQMYSCSIVISDGHENINMPVRKMELQDIVNMHDYTAVEIQVSSFSDILPYENIPVSQLPLDFPHSVYYYESRQICIAYYACNEATDQAIAECKEELEQRLQAAKQNLDNALAQSESESTTSLKYAHQAAAYARFEFEVNAAYKAYSACVVAAYIGL